MLDQDFTLSAWFRIDTANKDQIMTLVSQGYYYSPTNTGYELRYRGDQAGDYMTFEARDTAGNFEWFSFGASQLNIGQWNHVLMSLDRGTGTIAGYVNGQYIRSRTTNLVTGVEGTHEFRIGRRTHSWGLNLLGQMDDVRVYHEALAAGDVTELYESAQLLTQPTKEVRQYYDAFNRWIASEADADGDPGTTADVTQRWFVYDGDQIAAQFQATGAAAPTMTYRYFWGLSVDELLA